MNEYINERIFLIIGNTILVSGIWWLWFVEYQRYQIDLVRQRLFDIRDDLFQQASEGIIPFNSKAYGMTRVTLNGLIRFAHDLSLLHAVVIFLLYKYVNDGTYVDRYRKRMDKAIDDLSTKEEKKVIFDTQLKMHIVSMRYIIYSSLLAIILVPAGLFFHIRTKELVERNEKHFVAVDAEANGIGEGEPSLAF